MKIRYQAFISACLTMLFATAAHALAIVNDDFATKGTDPADTDANYYGSSNSNAIELNATSVGLVTGTSGRQIHGIFDTHTLRFVGDTIKATVIFTTPATVSPGNDDMRVGLFDHLERISGTELGQNTSYSSGSPSPLFQGLFGYYTELDIESADAATDLDIRKSNPSNSGRLLAASDGFTPLGSGPDVGYAFAANTQYTVTMTFRALADNGLEITTDFSGFGASGNGTTSLVRTDTQPLSYSFGMLAMGASSGALGSTNTNGQPDNGLEINSFVVEVIEGGTNVPVTPFVPEPPEPPVDPNLTQVVNDDLATDGTANTDASYYGSSSSSAIEIGTNSVGLVSGTSGRQIHALFTKQSLVNPNDSLTATIDFTTPATVATTGGQFRLGLFDPLDRSGADRLGQDTNYSTANPNDDYRELPGYLFQLDVAAADAAADFEIRRHNIAQMPGVTTGRLLASTSGFESLPGSSGPDVGYAILPNSKYSIELKTLRTEADALDISVTLTNITDPNAEAELGTLTLTDTAPGSFDFGMLGLGAGGSTFGSTTDAGNADNGIEITRFDVDVVAPPVVPDAEIGVVVDDNFAEDGTAETDASYFYSSNASGIEFNANSIGLVSGSSGRQIHALFPASVTLAQPGDRVRTSVTFTTPATVATGNEDFRLGIFDHLGRTSENELGNNTTFSSSSPNPLFQGLPGYFVEVDVELFDPRSDLQIRRHDVGKDPDITTGRLLNTTNGWQNLANSPDIGYTIEPNTTYTINVTFERTPEDGLSISSDFFGRVLNVVDPNPASFEFGMLAMNSSSGAFGSSRNPNEPDNGIDIDNVNVRFIRSAPVIDDLANDGTAETDAAYFGSSGSNAIETVANSIGLVSGTSSRQIHSLFPVQSLTTTGDSVTTYITFNTPATVGAVGEELRLGLFDPLDRANDAQLAKNTSYSSTNPNVDYNDLPGYLFQVDVATSDQETDFEIRRHNVGQTPTASTGRLLSTTSGFDRLDGSGDPAIGYSIAANTSYTIALTAQRVAQEGSEQDGLDLSISLTNNDLAEGLGMLKLSDPDPASFNFGMLGLGASGGAFGSSNAQGNADNGIEITDVRLRYEPFYDLTLVDLPEIVPPPGNHPDVEIIPTIPGGGGSGGGGTNPGGNNPGGVNPGDSGGGNTGGGSTVGNTTPRPVISALPAIINMLLSRTPAEIVAEYFDLDPNKKPWENFDLTDWALDTPNSDLGPITDDDGNVFGNGDTFSARTQDFHFAAGAQFPGSEPFFFTGSDGAMVFKSTVFGSRTSENTSFVRSELREMLRAGNQEISTTGVGANNWALDHQPFNPNIGARGGRLTATLSIDHVTTSGAGGQVGRFIIGQIHASKDEPVRLYYRKLPNNDKGGIYVAHEIRESNDILIDIIGSRADNAANPEDGIALGELFSYEINNVGANLEIIIRRGDSDGEIIGETTIDMLTANVGGTSSGYELPDEWMYFKAGAYSQNNTGWANDFDQVRFYRLENTHGENVDPNPAPN